MKKLFLPATASLALVGALSAQTVLVNFDGASTDFTNNFTGSTATVTAFSWNSTSGVSGGGGVAVSTDTGGANYNYNTAYDFGAGSATNTWTVSAFFKTNATTGTSANQVAGVGLVGTVTDEFAAAGRFVGVTLRQGTASTANLSLATTVNTTGTQSNTLQSTVFTPTTNNWYKLVVSITKTATADTFSVSGRVEDWGANGTTDPGVALRSFGAVNITNAALYADTSVFAGFYARQTAGNPIQIQAVDNFQVIPEPSAFAALAGLGALGFVATRRRRHG